MPLSSRNLFLDGPAGALETLVETVPDRGVSRVAVLCHPHPLYGGNMHNKVVYSVARECLALGCPVVRFNFRGVDGSGGSFDEGRGEADDLEYVAAWAEEQFPGVSVWLGGFSFGAAMVARVAGRQRSDRVLLIAPPVGRDFFPANFSLPAGVPLGVIHGTQDQLIPFAEVEKWAASVSGTVCFLPVTGADHFFHGQLTPLREAVHRFLT